MKCLEEQVDASGVTNCGRKMLARSLLRDVVVLLLSFLLSAHSATICMERFVIDADPDVGYTAGDPLDSGAIVQGPDTLGMTNYNWNASVNTSVWKADGEGLNFASTGSETGGSALWIGHASAKRDVSRLIDDSVTVASSEEYWMSIMIRASGSLDTSGLALGGFGNSADPSNASGNPQGYWVGVKGDGVELDLVLHHRDEPNTTTTDVLVNGININTTYLVIIKVVVNASTYYEGLSVWVNPSDASSEAGLGSPVAGLTPSAALFSTGFDRLSFYGDSLDMEIRFDQPTLGATLRDVAPPPPGTLFTFE